MTAKHTGNFTVRNTGIAVAVEIDWAFANWNFAPIA
jgi:hypothetical protein